MPEETKANHRVNIVEIREVLPHPNADTLGLVHIDGYQVVVKLGEFKAGDRAVYIQPDSVVPEEEVYSFLWKKSEGDEILGPVPERRRRVKAIKLRKQESEGLLLTIDSVRDNLPDTFEVGDDVAPFLGIYHYEPPEPEEEPERQQKRDRRWPRSFKGWFFYVLNFIPRLLGLEDIVNGQVGGASERGPGAPVYDVESLKNHPDTFSAGEPVVVTEKIHGSNARYLFTNDKMYAGSRNLWKSERSNCVWRKALALNPWIETWCRAHPGEVLYGEVTPTQKFADGTLFDYGSGGEVRFSPFAIFRNGQWNTNEAILMHNAVPVLYRGPFDIDKIKAKVDGQSVVAGASHIREGAVVTADPERRSPGRGRAQMKIVSNEFLRRT